MSDDTDNVTPEGESPVLETESVLHEPEEIVSDDITIIPGLAYDPVSAESHEIFTEELEEILEITSFVDLPVFGMEAPIQINSSDEHVTEEVTPLVLDVEPEKASSEDLPDYPVYDAEGTLLTDTLQTNSADTFAPFVPQEGIPTNLVPLELEDTDISSIEKVSQETFTLDKMSSLSCLEVVEEFFVD